MFDHSALQPTTVTVTDYRVTLTHPDLTGPYVADVLATSPERAELRVRHSAMTLYRHHELLRGGTCEVVAI